LPRIDTRDFQALLEEKKAMVPLYTPEWDISDEKDAGVALLNIFTHMQEEIINRLNRVPDKHFTAFLEMLGIQLIPAQPARVPVSFYLSKGSEGAFIPARTQVVTEETEEHGALVFETTKGFYASKATIEEIFCVHPEKDEIFCYSNELKEKKEKKEFKLFEGDKNLQEHVLYLGHADYFNLKEPTKIELQFTGSVEELANYKWEYWGEDEENPEQFDNPGNDSIENIITLTLPSGKEIKEKEINGIKSHWIHCRRENISGNLPVIDSITIKNIAVDQSGYIQPGYIQPDLGFYNSLPVDVTGEFYPFGSQPRLFDTFYLGSKEAFSKIDATITITFRRENKPVPVPNNVELLWEYWNGTVWQFLGIEDHISNFDFGGNNNGHVIFNCPEIKEKSVNGQDNYWIRVLLIKGDYGKEEYKPEKSFLFSISYNQSIKNELDNNTIRTDIIDKFEESEIYISGSTTVAIIQNDRWMIVDYETNTVFFVEKEGPVEDPVIKFYRKVSWVAVANFNPPVITGIEITYNIAKVNNNLQQCLAKNNLEFQDFTQHSKGNNEFKPFIPLPEKDPTIYMGFNNIMKKGNISIFFSLIEEIYTPVTGGKIQWSYWKRAPNLYEKITDVGELHLVSTEGISKDGELLLEEASGQDFIMQTVNIQSYSDNTIIPDMELDFKYSNAARIFQRNRLEVSDHTEYITKNGTMEFIGPRDQSKTRKFGKESHWFMGTLLNVPEEYDPPLLKGIYPNTVWAEQVETIKDEILGSGDGKTDKRCQFLKHPVISPEVWVMEGNITQDEKKKLSKESIREKTDTTGKIKETWVRWKAVDLVGSEPRSRHYMVDNSTGEVTFGDGEKGMIPPIGKDNIKADYKSGGGVEGNLPENEVHVLRSSTAGIDHIVNHEAAEGGSDTELLEEVFERGPHLIKHRDRAVTEEDFERLAREASNYIARTRCVPKENTLHIIVIPKGEEDKPIPSRGLKEIVKNHLLERSLNLISGERIRIDDPSYVEIQVTVNVIPEFIEGTVPLEKEILKQLKAYFHPLTGGNEKRGWEFGRDVHMSDVYAMLEGIKGLDHVEDLKINGESGDVKIDELQIACTGAHRITMKLGVIQ